ncbi:MAG: hypothetical protein H0U70_12835 [Tatlockia sp.]|nr:hypothetical protein [Tatlockia sp.]
MKKQYFKTITVALFASLMIFNSPAYEGAASTLDDHSHLLRSNDPIDGGWLPNLTGLPNEGEVDLLKKQVTDVMAQETDEKCTSIDYRLRLMVFQHFAIHQHIANVQNVYFDETVSHRWAHFLAMILKESSGDSTNVTGMSGRSVSTNEASTNFQHWKSMFKRAVEDRIKLNYQTNFGLTQTSADRLFLAFHLAKTQALDYLEGKEGAATPRKVDLNTAIAIRRLIWFYQDFAQGRLTQNDERIYKEDINKPELSDRYRAGLKRALLYCGTEYMFQEDPNEGINQPSKLEMAMDSIAYCKLGNSQSGYGKNEFDEKCFAEWVTLCPALNIDIAHITPLSYFATRGEKPVCEETFKRLLKPKSDIK